MLTLKLTLNGKVTVRANEAQSHSFSLHDLRLNDAELKAFVQNPRLYGSRLFQALFKDGSAAKTAFDELSKQTVRTIVLVLDSPALDGVAWEYAYNEVKQEYVVEDCAFMRALPESERPANGRLKESVERVSLLFIPANPLVDLNAEPMRELDVDGEWREMTRHITASHAPFDLLQLRPATPEQLQTSMARFRDGLAVHFSGHGAAMKDGTILLFERENGAANPLGAQEFIRAVKDKTEIVFLSACQSAAAEKTEFGNLARGLVKSGVPFALGMQFNLPDPFAPVISGQFYNWLAQGHAIPEATMQARRAVKREHEFFVGMIALYAAHPDETGKLNWRGSGASLAQTIRPADVSDLPSPSSGLIGRQRELMRIGTQLIEGMRSGPLTVTLHGAGGIGKTAMLWQSLLRFAPSFDLILALALDPLPSLESILGRIERFLGLPSPCANETKERETLVRARLTSKRTLLGLDNFETLNYALNEKGSDEEKTSKSLHAFFKSLAANGVTLCVTSREVTNLPGETIEDIQGLTNENGGRLFQENVVRQKDEIYIEKTQQVSELVGGHPLALRLLASAFDDQVGTSLDQYIEDLQSHLPKARDKWTEEDRHESLRASFDFTMRNLVKTEEGRELQVALSRLSVFVSFFATYMVAPTLAGKWTEEEEDGLQQDAANKIVRKLWERGLLERLVLILQNGSDYLYRLHPTLSHFAAEHVLLEDLPVMQETHFRAMRLLADISYPGNVGGGIYSNPFLAKLTNVAIPDMLKSTKLKQDKETYTLLYHLAFLIAHFGDWDGAMQLYQQSFEIAKDLGNLQGKSASLFAMAEIYVKRGDLDTPMELYQQSLEIAEGSGDLNGKSVTLHSMAGIYATRGDLDRAMQLYQKSLKIKESLGNLQGQSASLYAMAGIYTTRGDLDRAMQLYQQVQLIDEGLGDLKSKSATLYAMAGIYVTHGELDRAMQLYQQSLEIIEDLGDLQGKSAMLYEMAYILRVHGDLDEAMNLYQQALEIVEGLGDLQGKATIIGEIGNVYVAHGDLKKGLELQKEKLVIVQGIGDKKEESVALHNLARIYVLRDDLNGAMQLYKQSQAIDESLGDLKGKSATLQAMADIYFMRDDLDEAMRLCQQSLEIKEGLGDLKGKSTTLHSMAGIYVLRGDLDGAMQFYLQSQAIDEVLGDIKGKAITLGMMSKAYWANHKHKEAIISLLNGLMQLVELEIEPYTQQAMASDMADWRSELGEQKFDSLWKEITGETLPEWLM